VKDGTGRLRSNTQQSSLNCAVAEEDVSSATARFPRRSSQAAHAPGRLSAAGRRLFRFVATTYHPFRGRREPRQGLRPRRAAMNDTHPPRSDVVTAAVTGPQIVVDRDRMGLKYEPHSRLRRRGEAGWPGPTPLAGNGASARTLPLPRRVGAV
jgi:hypothetical protein